MAATETAVPFPDNLRIGDALEVYLRTIEEWRELTVKDIYEDEDGPWFLVRLQNNTVLEIPRYSKDVRPTRSSKPRGKPRSILKSSLRSPQSSVSASPSPRNDESILSDDSQQSLNIMSPSDSFLMRERTETLTFNIHGDDSDDESKDGVSPSPSPQPQPLGPTRDDGTDADMEHEHVRFATINSSRSIDHSDDDDDEKVTADNFDPNDDSQFVTDDDYSTSSEHSDSMNSVNSLTMTETHSRHIVDHSDDSSYIDSDSSDDDAEWATMILIVDRAGSDIVNGKYMYVQMKRGCPSFQSTLEPTCWVWYKYDDMWVVEYNKQDLYAVYSDDDLPPSQGWQTIDNGELPAPGIVKERIKQRIGLDQKTKERDFESDSPDKYSPIEMIKKEFLINVKFGFKLHLERGFVCVSSLGLGQAIGFEVKEGDILTNIDDEDVSLLADPQKVHGKLADHIRAARAANRTTIELTFGRRKETFPIVILNRAGTAGLDGKYSISGKATGCWRFVKNDDEAIEISRVFFDENESVWVIKRQSEDLYCALSGPHEDFPPNYGWEAIAPSGVYPAPGLTTYSIPMEQTMSTPIITKVQADNKRCTIYFECDEDGRKPNVCPHMEVWYEVEAVNLTDNVTEPLVQRCEDSPCIFPGLNNGDQYQFRVKSYNELTCTQSELSDIVMPLQKAPKPKIVLLEGSSNSASVHFEVTENPDNPSIRAQLHLKVDPPVDVPPFETVRPGYIKLDNDVDVVHMNNLQTGVEYTVQILCINDVSRSYSLPETVIPCRRPNAPVLTRVVPGSRELTVFFDCDGWNDDDVQAWFEVETDPPQPTWEDLEKIMAETRHDKGKTKQRKMTRGTKVNLQVFRRRTVTKSINMSNSHIPNYMDFEDEDIPEFRRHPRYFTNPLVIEPFINGIGYSVVIKACNLNASVASNPSSVVVPQGKPPVPRILTVSARAGYAKIEFECDDYATKEFRAAYEIRSYPPGGQVKVHGSPAKVRNLQFGKQYAFAIRAVNKLGHSSWSDKSDKVTTLKVPPIPIELRTVAGAGKISVFWCGENSNSRPIQGWFEVVTNPATQAFISTRQQATFTGLENGTQYKFRVFAVNAVGRSKSEWSQPTKPKGNIGTRLYSRNIQKAREVMDEQRRQHFNFRKNKRGGDYQFIQKSTRQARVQKMTNQYEEEHPKKKAGSRRSSRRQKRGVRFADDDSKTREESQQKDRNLKRLERKEQLRRKREAKIAEAKAKEQEAMRVRRNTLFASRGRATSSLDKQRVTIIEGQLEVIANSSEDGNSTSAIAGRGAPRGRPRGRGGIRRGRGRGRKPPPNRAPPQNPKRGGTRGRGRARGGRRA